ncbi:MAG: glutamate racemase, partial [Clostridiales bacterium]|nr:glutamate racemase [Clostridiales bacterium]
CPLFCPLVEEGWLKDPVTVEVATRYLDPLLETGIDTLVMGCTHYPLLRPVLRQIMGEKVTLVNPAYETARELKELLEQHGLANDGRQSCEGTMHRFYVSDGAKKFRQFANTILPFGVDTTQLIHIEDY